KAGRVIDPMTYIAKGAGAGLSKIGDITKGLKGVGNIDIPTLPDGSVHLPDGHQLAPNGNLVGPNGTIDTTPVPHDVGPTTPTVPHGTTPTLPAHWTTQGAQTPSYAGMAQSVDGTAHTVDNAAPGGHYNPPPTAPIHTPGGAFDPTPAPSTYDHTPTGTQHGQTPSASPYGQTPSGSPYGQTPSGSPYGQAPSGSPYGHAPSPGTYDHAPAPSAYDQAPPPSSYDTTPTTAPHPGGHPGAGTPWYSQTTGANPVHDVPPAPHPGGPDVPGSGAHPGASTPWYHQTTGPANHAPTAPHPGGPDVPGTGGHGPGHDAPGTGHADDAAHGANHANDAAHGANHADDAAHAGDHGDIAHDAADAAVHHGTDAPAAPGHQGADTPGHGGAGEPFEYKPHVSNKEWAQLSTAEKHRVAYAEVSEGTVPFARDTDAIKYGQDTWNHYAENMPPERKQAVWDYTDEPDYTQPAPHPTDGWATYKEMNGYLRSGDPSKLTPYVQHNIDEVDKALAGRAVPEDVMVVRGTGLGHIEMDSPFDMLGKTYDDKGYMSTSLGNHPVGAFADEEAILHLRVPKGTPALWVEKVGKFGQGEREILLGRGTEYRVTRVFMENGQVQVYGEVLPR
ncbi:ADP-ribosyltransferase, partial [Streptomyces olindensis]|uniref:ADP-ribosyltransferase n=1 Tax=Streptomyces olindensis TaxID=358823 RepID=UPI0033D86065